MIIYLTRYMPLSMRKRYFCQNFPLLKNVTGQLQTIQQMEQQMHES
ncbi:hypothetical protein FBUS_10599 [Fasciolopsis buskii]|uniref:Uncharacterized protein n=1 Tax=Fasciolopsis buskii TaxID=27845 RepID=A0A8E0RMK3_9TREM|nr:hypothetical protein FBUS_10599 [Fasciolopsis buski]